MEPETLRIIKKHQKISLWCLAIAIPLTVTSIFLAYKSHNYTIAWLFGGILACQIIPLTMLLISKKYLKKAEEQKTN